MNPLDQVKKALIDPFCKGQVQVEEINPIVLDVLVAGFGEARWASPRKQSADSNSDSGLSPSPRLEVRERALFLANVHILAGCLTRSSSPTFSVSKSRVPDPVIAALYHRLRHSTPLSSSHIRSSPILSSPSQQPVYSI